MSENDRVISAAGTISFATFLSRILGFIRDVVIASFFGAGMYTDAFFVAFRIPNLLRRLLAEGSLTIAFIPVFTKYLSNCGKKEAFDLAISLIRILAVLLGFIVILGIWFSPVIVGLIAPGFADFPEKFAVTVFLTRIIFPYIFFASLVAVCMGILNAMGHFLAPALSPALLNIAMICSVLIISPYMTVAITGLAIGALIGGFLQLALQVPVLIKKGLYFWGKATVIHPGVNKIGKLMLPAMFGAAAYQINIFVGTVLASLLPEGSVSYLYYADRLVQFPLGIFAIAIATAILPSFSRQAAAKDFDSIKDTFAHGMKLVFFIILPCMAGLIVLREPVVALLFKRGAFGDEAIRLTASALLNYSVGLWAFSAVRILYSAYYALQDTKTPVKITTIAIVFNIIFGIILMGPLKHGGLALATSLSSMLNFVLLSRSLSLKIGSFGWQKIMLSVFRSGLCSILMGIAVSAISFFLISLENASFCSLLGGTLASIITGIIVYLFLSFITRSPELQELIDIVGRGMKKI